MSQLLDISVDRFNALPQGVRKRVVDLLMRWGRHEEVLPFVQVMADEQPTAVYYRARFAEAAAELGRDDVAEAAVREIELDWPDAYHSLTARGILHLARGEHPEALKAFLQILSHRPESPTAHYQSARVYFQAGILDKALEYARAAHEFYERPDRNGRRPLPPPGLILLLADLHERSGDAGLARDLRSDLAQRESMEVEELLRILNCQAVDARTSSGPSTRRARPEPEPVEPEPDPTPAPPLPVSALKILKDSFAYDSFKPGQEEVIARILNGESLIAIMPTGGGKSLCYQLPALLLPGLTLVISPLIALMKDQLDSLPAAVREKATLINSMLDSDEVERRVEAMGRGAYRLVYAAPERLRQEPFLHALSRVGVSLFVVDEVHCVSIWGHDFRPDYLFIPQALERLGGPAFLGMTATATPAMRREIRSQLGRPLTLVSAGTFRPNLRLEVMRMKSDEEKMRALIDICTSERGSGIVYVTAREKAEELAALLRRKHVRAYHYHAGMERSERDIAQEDFMSGSYRVMVATVAFGMGVDKSDVRFVIHYSLPRSLENYYQEAGRAGRDGQPSRCVLFYSAGDKARLTRWMKEGRLSLEIIKSAYASIKEQTGGSMGLISEDDIRRDAGVEETGAKIATSLLERANLIRRHLDLPRSVTIRATRSAWQDDAFAAFAESARLLPDQSISHDLFELAGRAGIHPADIEGRLLDWRDRGLVRLHQSGRAPFVEMLPVRESVVPAIRQMLASYEESCLDKIGDLISYVSTPGCRHVRIAQHFGGPAPPGCRACDICLSPPQRSGGRGREQDVRGQAEQSTSRVPAPDGTTLHKTGRLILDGVRLLPIRLGKRGLVRALKGSVACPLRPHEWKYLGALDHLPASKVEEAVDKLIDAGYLTREGTPERPLLALTDAGSALLG